VHLRFDSLAAAEWEALVDAETGTTYYHHAASGETTWENPLLAAGGGGGESQGKEEGHKQRLLSTKASSRRWSARAGAFKDTESAV